MLRMTLIFIVCIIKSHIFQAVSMYWSSEEIPSGAVYSYPVAALLSTFYVVLRIGEDNNNA